MYRQRMHREHPQATRREIDGMITTWLAEHHDDREGNPRRHPPRRVEHRHRTDVNQPVHHEREVDLSGQPPASLHWIAGTPHIKWRQQVGTQSSEAMDLLVLGHSKSPYLVTQDFLLLIQEPGEIRHERVMTASQASA